MAGVNGQSRLTQECRLEVVRPLSKDLNELSHYGVQGSLVALDSRRCAQCDALWRAHIFAIARYGQHSHCEVHIAPKGKHLLLRCIECELVASDIALTADYAQYESDQLGRFTCTALDINLHLG